LFETVFWDEIVLFTDEMLFWESENTGAGVLFIVAVYYFLITS
jgi:hypothetical protein